MKNKRNTIHASGLLIRMSRQFQRKHSQLIKWYSTCPHRFSNDGTIHIDATQL